MAKALQNKVTSYLSANFTEDEVLWQIAALYNYADERRDGHYIYKYAGADGTNSVDAPSIDYLKKESVRVWVRIHATNYWAMLDGNTSTQTQNADIIMIEIDSSNYDSLCLLDVAARSVKLELLHVSEIEPLYTKIFELQDESTVVDEYSYWFSDFTMRPSVFTDDIPLFSDATLRITIDNTGGIVKCGRLVHGRSFYIGVTQYGATLDFESYSLNQTDPFGNTELMHREPLDRDSFDIQVPTSKIPILRRRIGSWDAIPLLFIMDESASTNVENFLNYGFIERFTTLWENRTTSMVSMTIKALKQVKG